MKDAHKTLSASDVSKAYGRVCALSRVSFTASQGEALALWGPNGAGKTTLLKCIMGLHPFEGRIEVMGRDAGKQGKEVRKYIGYVPQELSFYEWSILETMEFYARIKKVSLTEIPPLLEKVGLTSCAWQTMSSLSGGLKQRVALALALLGNPSILLFDEPTANLDARAREDFLALLHALKLSGKTILFASHRTEEVEALASNVLLLEKGKLTEILSCVLFSEKFQPSVHLILWTSEANRSAGFDILKLHGFAPKTNGKGTIEITVPKAKKSVPFTLLYEKGIRIENFEVETPWT